jgi:hypothetical protein
VLLQAVAYTLLECAAISYAKVLPGVVLTSMHGATVTADIPKLVQLINMPADEVQSVLAHRKPCP